MKGRRILCRYDGDPKWHERLLLGQFDHDGYIWVIATPDGDVHAEDYKNDVTDVRVVPLAGGRPSGLIGPIYPFRSPPTAAERAAFNREAVEILKSSPPEPIADADESGGGDRRQATHVDLSSSGPEHAVAPADVGFAWYTVDSSPDGKLAAGVLLDGNYSSCIVSGDKGVFVLSGGGCVYGALKKISESEEFCDVA